MLACIICQYLNCLGGARIIFCSASCPETLQDIVDSVVDRESLHYVRSPRIHTLLSHVKQKFIRVREMEKMEKLAEILERPGTKGQSLVFCKVKTYLLFRSSAFCGLFFF